MGQGEKLCSLLDYCHANIDIIPIPTSLSAMREVLLHGRNPWNQLPSLIKWGEQTPHFAPTFKRTDTTLCFLLILKWFLQVIKYFDKCGSIYPFFFYTIQKRIKSWPIKLFFSGTNLCFHIQKMSYCIINVTRIELGN